MEGRPLGLGRLLDEAEHLGAAGLVHARLEADVAHGVEHAQHADGRNVGRVLRHLEGDLHVALRGQVVDLLWRDRLERADEAVLVDQVAVVERQPVAHVVDAPGVEGAAPPHEAVNVVALVEEELGEVAAVLPSDPGDQRLLRCQCPSEADRSSARARQSTSAWAMGDSADCETRDGGDDGNDDETDNGNGQRKRTTETDNGNGQRTDGSEETAWKERGGGGCRAPPVPTRRRNPSRNGR